MSEVGLEWLKWICCSQRLLRKIWTRFALVAAAKEWKAAKRATVLPMLLHGILVDIFIELSEETRDDLMELKKTIMCKVGLTKAP